MNVLISPNLAPAPVSARRSQPAPPSPRAHGRGRASAGTWQLSGSEPHRGCCWFSTKKRIQVRVFSLAQNSPFAPVMISSVAFLVLVSAEPPGTWGPLPSGARLAPWERRRVSRSQTRLDMERDQSEWLSLDAQPGPTGPGCLGRHRGSRRGCGDAWAAGSPA